MARWGLLVLVLVATAGSAGCRPHPRSHRGYACHQLFGHPGPHTGLGDSQCGPRCDEVGFAPRDYDEEDELRLLEWTLVDPPALLTSDPYADPPPLTHPGPDAVCAVLRVSSETLEYRLVDYPDAATARAAGAMPTHFGTCGVCSNLHDLAVYMHDHDLTREARHCGFFHHPGSDRDIECLVELGFTRPCAQIWAYNSRNTARACRAVCIADVFERYNHADGTLNPCLRCDEEHSGPIFKAVGGRTRRNSGLPDALCRPCSDVHPLVHDYEVTFD